MYNKELPPPFVPQLKSMDDTHLFDDIFTKEPAFDSPIQTPLSHTHQGAFEGFTYTGNFDSERVEFPARNILKP